MDRERPAFTNPAESFEFLNNPYGIREYLTRYLVEEGHNPDLFAGIEYHARHLLFNSRMELSALTRIAGPEEGMLYPAIQAEWDETIEQYTQGVRNGEVFPPLIAVDFLDRSQRLQIADGNKRDEALLSAGVETYPTILCLTSIRPTF